MLYKSFLRPSVVLALMLVGLLGQGPWSKAAVLPDLILFQDGYRFPLQGTDSFNEDLRDHFTVIGGKTTDAALVQQLRSEGKLFFYNVWIGDGTYTTQQMVDTWSAPFNDTRGGELPGGFDAIEINEILPWHNGSVNSNRVVAALGQLRDEYTDKIIAAFSAQEFGWNTGLYSNMLNAINDHADLFLFEAYLDEYAAPDNVLWHANMATLLENQVPGLIDKTIFALLSYQGNSSADSTTDIGFWGFLDAQMHAIRNHPVTSRMPGIGSYYYSLGLTTDFMGRAMDHYYVQGNTDYFGDGDMTQMVSNPQFENSTSGWELDAGAGGSVGIFNYDSEPVSNTHGVSWNIPGGNCCSHGTYGLKTVRGSEANEVSYAATVEAGLTYHISAYVHAGTGGDFDDAKVQIMTDSGNLIAEGLGSQMETLHGLPNPWKAITFNFVANPGQEDIRIVFTDDAADPGDVFYWDFVEMEDAFVPDAPVGPFLEQYQWLATGGGSWHTASNWLPNANPNSSDTQVLLTGATASTADIHVDQATTVAMIDIDGSTDYRIAGQGTTARLELQQNFEGTSEINVMAGDHVFDIPVTVGENAKIAISSGASLSLDDTFVFHGKTITKEGEGRLNINDNTNSGFGTLRLDGGMLGGSGAINGDLVASEGVIDPGEGVGTLDIHGYLMVDSGATLQIDIAGPSSHDQLFVGYDANLSGSLEINLLDGYEPNNGDQFLVMFANSVTDSGLTIEGPSASYFQHAAVGNVLLLTAVDPLVTQWTGGASGDWNAGANWSTAAVPNSNQVRVNFAGTAVPATSVQLNSTVTVRELTADDSSSLQLSGSGTIQLDSQFSQADVVVTGGDHTLNVGVHADVNMTVDIAQGASLSLDDTFDFHGVTVTKQGEGRLHINSSTNSGSGTLEVIEGELGGSGDINGDLVASGGIVAPGQSVGMLDVRGDFTLGVAATLQIELDGPSSNDLLLVNDDADLSGLLDVVLAGGYQPAQGAQFLVMIADNITGSGLTLAGANAANFQVDAVGGTLILTSLFTGLPGDYNEDGVVDAADYTVWADSVGQAGAGLAADGDGNGVIEQADYDLWKTHFTSTTASGSEVDRVPEPTTLLLALLVLLSAPLRVLRG
ncbi:MAG: hypothetical protein MK161_09525 [Pirellulales bacterium]|nr:hypothetical protein [Pirellulales bacterium]